MPGSYSMLLPRRVELWSLLPALGFLPTLACNTSDFVTDSLTDATVADVLIVTEPAVLDFGHVEVNTERGLPLTLRNQGTRTLVVQGLSLEGVGSFSLPGFSGLTLGPGERSELVIKYAPRGFEAAAANLVIRSSDPLLPEVTVGLAGRCDPPEIALSPRIYDFGATHIGCTLEQPLTLRNLGDGPLRVSRLEFQSTSTELTLDSSILSVPFELGAGDTQELVARYVPLAAVSVEASLEIDSNDPLTPTVSATLLAEGLVAGEIRDRFAVSDNGKVDILFVVDNSGSMGDNQSTLVANFANFYDIIQALQLDWQIGVVTTDNGVLNGTYRIITPDTPNIQSNFSSNALVGIYGSGDEQGLEFAYQALSQPLVDQQNRGFLRPEAGLRLIILSDEEDSSPRSVDYYVSFFQNLKLNPDMVTLSAITGGIHGCNTQCGAADDAQRYAQAVAATGGIQANICECDFIGALEVLAQESQVFQTTFPLSQTPVVETLRVFVNDLEDVSSWDYDASLNAVVFQSEELTPQNGERVELVYELKLECGD